MGNREADLAEAAARWKQSGAAIDLIQVAGLIPVGTNREQVQDLLGAPINRSKLASGGEIWTYVKSNPDRNQREALIAVFSSGGGFVRLDRKPID